MNSPSNTAAGAGIVDELTRAGISALSDLYRTAGDLARLGLAMNPLLQALTEAQRRTSCDIPPPCWIPRALGELHSVVCAGATATVRVCVTNCQARAGEVKLAVSPVDLPVKIDPPSASLAPMERRCFTVSLNAAADACKGSRSEVLLWVHGCNAHFLRWTLEVGDSGGASCHELDVDDCPDHVHHWYDHFYCVRPCFDRTRATVGDHG